MPCRRRNVAALLELDDVIDPADMREAIARTLAAAPDAPERPPRRFVDPW